MKRILLFLLFSVLLMTPVRAEGPSIDVSVVEKGLSEEAREVGGELKTDGSYDLDGALARLWRKAKTETRERLRAEGREMTRIAAIAVLCAVSEAVCTESRIRELLSICACAAVAVGTAGSIDSLTGEMNAAIQAMNTYARTALPAVYTAAAVSGAVVSAGAKYAAVLLCLNIMMDLLGRLTLPLIYAYLALCISRSVFPNAVLNAAASTAKWLAVSVMTLLTTGASAYITLTGALSGSADAIAVKGTKTVIAGMLPVVGGILSDAASVVLAGAAVIRNSAGVFALIGVCALTLTPFLAIGVKLLLFRLCAAVASAVEGKRLAGLLGDLSAALGMLLGVLGSLSILLFLAFMAAIRTVSA